jgi:hypothetical protein
MVFADDVAVVDTHHRRLHLVHHHYLDSYTMVGTLLVDLVLDLRMEIAAVVVE